MRITIYIASIILLYTTGWVSHMMFNREEAMSSEIDNSIRDRMNIETFRPMGTKLENLRYKHIHDGKVYQRKIVDRRYCVWTRDKDRALKIIGEYGISVSDIELNNGEVFAVFLNDSISEHLVAMLHNTSTGLSFADYLDSGIYEDMEAPQDGNKWTRVTAVVFTPIRESSHFGMRSMALGLSEKQ